MPNKILVNIGNTHTEVSNWDFSMKKNYKTELFLAESAELFLEPAEVYVSTVVPSFRESLTATFPNCSFSLLNYEAISGLLDFSKVDASTIGADRLANALALQELDLLAGMVIDCGTCITGEIVSKDAEFVGGFIMPGRSLQRRALKLHTGQLPEVALLDEQVSFPGQNTVSSIQNGIDRAAVAAVQSFVDEARALYGKGLKVLLNGGDAKFFLENVKGTETSPKNLTLIGIRAFAKLLV